jgi:hypothetical protein
VRPSRLSRLILLWRCSGMSTRGGRSAIGPAPERSARGGIEGRGDVFHLKREHGSRTPFE